MSATPSGARRTRGLGECLVCLLEHDLFGESSYTVDPDGSHRHPDAREAIEADIRWREAAKAADAILEAATDDELREFLRRANMASHPSSQVREASRERRPRAPERRLLTRWRRALRWGVAGFRHDLAVARLCWRAERRTSG